MTEGWTLNGLTDAGATAPDLAAAGLTPDAAEAKARRLAACAHALLDAGSDGAAPARAFFVPGRVEVLGKHTDYAGGRSIVAAVEQGVCLVAVPRADGHMRIAATDMGARCEYDLSPDLTPTVGHWSNYPMTVARRVARNFPGELRGADLAYAGDLPHASGMSSSSAVMVANFLALSAVNALDGRPEYLAEIADAESLAGYLGTVENGQSFGTLAGDRGVGTFGGSEDHVAMLCSSPGVLSQYSYCPVRPERRIAFPAGFILAIASSGVVAAKTGQAMAKYNRASALARAAVEVWNARTHRHDPHLAAALAGGDDVAESADRMRRILLGSDGLHDFTAKELWARFEHFLAESEQIIPPAGAALADAAIEGFGKFVDSSQHFAEKLLGNQVPETVFLARAARELGAAAASAFGAGFGGSVWAMVRGDQADAFLADWAAKYQAAHPEPARRAAFFRTLPGPAAMELAPAR